MAECPALRSCCPQSIVLKITILATGVAAANRQSILRQKFPVSKRLVTVMELTSEREFSSAHRQCRGLVSLYGNYLN